MSQSVDTGVFHASLKTCQPGAIEEHCKSVLLTTSRGAVTLVFLACVAYIVFQLKTHVYLFQAPEGQEEEEELEMSPLAAGTALLLITIVTSFVADCRE